MKKFYYLLPAVALMLGACSDDDDNKGNGLGSDGSLTVSGNIIEDAPGDGEIDEVRLVVYYESGSHTQEYIAARSEWNNGFSLKFPETLSDQYTDSVEEFIDDDELLEVLTVSDKDARMAWAEIEGYKNGKFVGTFYLGKETSRSEIDIVYFYTDRPVSIKGSITERYGEYIEVYKYDLNLGKGWNRVADIWDEVNDDQDNYTLTTSIPSGLSWYFY